MKEGNIKLSKYATAPVFFRAFELKYKIIIRKKKNAFA
jgi:hypothetical protein